MKVLVTHGGAGPLLGTIVLVAVVGVFGIFYLRSGKFIETATLKASSQIVELNGTTTAIQSSDARPAVFVDAENSQSSKPMQKNNRAKNESSSLLLVHASEVRDSPYWTLPHQLSSRAVDSNENTFKNNIWKCCVDPLSVEAVEIHPPPQQVQDANHNYVCPSHPSNFSWFYSSSDTSNNSNSTTNRKHNNYNNSGLPQMLNRTKWQNTTILIVGDSTSRQMMEQFRWEMPMEAKTSTNLVAYYLLQHNRTGKPYKRNHSLDLGRLEPSLLQGLQKGYNFLIFNVATWWDTTNIGHVMDTNGTSWNITGKVDTEWSIVKSNSNTPSSSSPPDISFAKLMEVAIREMVRHKHPRTKLIWRSEGHTNCPPGSNFRSSIVPVLQKFPQVNVLNISQATCDFLEARSQVDKTEGGPHLCFPSVALRHWMLAFQDQFLTSS